MGRRIFLSFLGTSNYEKCIYNEKNKKSRDVKFVQNAIIELENNNFDEKYIICTPTSKEKTYNLMLEEYRENAIPSNKEWKVIDINEKNNEEGIWEIFEEIFNVFKNGDEVIFDITHSFRYIPMLGITLLQMSKFLRNIKVEKILYGEYKSKEIIDLTSFSALQDWILAGYTLVKTGRGEEIKKLTEKDLGLILKESNGKDEEAQNLRSIATEIGKMTLDFRTNRGEKIIKSYEINKIKENIKKIKEDRNLLIPFKLILERMGKDIENFEKGNLNNLFHTVQWCIDKDLVQQGMTILEEGITTKLMEKLELEEKFYDENERKKISDILRTFKEYNKENIEINSYCEEEIEKIKNKLSKIKNIEKLADIHSKIKEGRNDINHSGFRKKSPMKAEKFSKNLEEWFKEMKEILEIEKIKVENEKKVEKKALLLFSHVLTENQKKELEEEFGVEKIENLPDKFQKIWSNVVVNQEYEENLETIKKYIIDNFNEEDIVLIQGSWGYTYSLVKWSIENNFIPIFSHSERNVEEIKEEENIKKISYFKHIKFLRYE